jgi:RNA polymerase-binding transcription factor DksA
MEIKCVKCKEVINPLRIKALPNTKVCINCSNVKGYTAKTTTNGEGDHTWNDIEIFKNK